MKYNRLLVLTLVLFLSTTSFAQPPAHEFGQFKTIEKQFDGSNLDGYNLYIPNSESNGVAMPVIVFLQGGLGVGDEVEKIFNWGLARLVKEGPTGDKELDQLRLNTFIYIMPHISQGQFYENPGAFKKIIEEVKSNYNVDADRIYLTGLSRGGHGTWGLGSRIPKEFAAIVPICGGQNGVENYKALSTLPIWTSHNPKDQVVYYSQTEEAVEKIEMVYNKDFYRSNSVASTEIKDNKRIFTSGNNPKKQHDAWNEMYASPKFYQWLLQFE